jgi:hypothetical protein
LRSFFLGFKGSAKITQPFVTATLSYGIDVIPATREDLIPQPPCHGIDPRKPGKLLPDAGRPSGTNPARLPGIVFSENMGRTERAFGSYTYFSAAST